jgi:cellulose synthase/poly-beta-1,6-N-acetylglucosamine synthase-like glycosyltransferase
MFPFVSVIMPVRNESRFIQRSLRAVLRQDYPLDRFEVLVVDGMSEDRTREIIFSMLSAEQAKGRVLSVKILDNPSGKIPVALNIGLRNAQGEIIVRVDGHCEVQPDYVRSCVGAIQKTDADCVGAMQRPQGESLVSRAISLAITSPFGVGNAYFRYREKGGWVDTIYLGAYKRQVFEQIGFFDEEMVCNEDDEFTFRIRQAGGGVWLEPSLQCRYYPRTTFGGLWNQYFRFGLYKVLVIKKRRRVASLRHLVPAFFVICFIAACLAATFSADISWMVPVAIPYIFFTLLFSCWAARKEIILSPFVAFSFLVIHISYGLGFIAGLWRWRKRQHETEADKKRALR